MLYREAVMNKHGVCIVLVLLLSSMFIVSNAQVEWHWVHPYPTGSVINGISFVSESTGWIVSYRGEIFTTTDYGQTWELQEHNDGELRGISFITPEVGWACGENGQGIIWRTFNGGENWTGAVYGNQILNAVDFYDEDYGTVVGNYGTIYRTNNGGDNWTIQGISTTANLQDVSFVSPAEGWICGYAGTLAYTETAGGFWNILSTPYSWNWTGVHFLNSSDGFVAGGELILKTEDGGDSWSVAANVSGCGGLQALEFNGATAVAPGHEGAAVSSNQGASWSWETLPELPFGEDLWYMMCADVTPLGRIYTAGTGGLVYTRSPSGDWTQVSKNHASEDLNAITNVGGTDVHACGDKGTILRSINGGATWSCQVFDENTTLLDVSFPSTDVGYIAGKTDGTNLSFVLKTVDGGVTWTQLSSFPSFSTGEMSLDFMDENKGIVVSNTGLIYTTVNGGGSFQQKTGFGDPHIRIRFGNTDRGWITTLAGSIICFDFNSDSWSYQPSPMTGHSLNALFPVNQDTVFAAGWNGNVLRTFDSGNYWQIVETTGHDYTDIWFDQNGQNGYVAGLRFGYSVNGGVTVASSPAGALENTICRLSFTDPGFGWGCGINGMILGHGENPSGTEEHGFASVPNGGSLRLTCNPFTEMSSVSFSMPVQGTVALNLYDITGRIVISIHRGVLPAGEHTFSVQGKDLAPGMYFLRLETETGSSAAPLVRIP